MGGKRKRKAVREFKRSQENSMTLEAKKEQQVVEVVDDSDCPLCGSQIVWNTCSDHGTCNCGEWNYEFDRSQMRGYHLHRAF